MYELDGFDEGLLSYIKKKTQEPLEKQIADFKNDIKQKPKSVVRSIRDLAEVTVSYLYFSLSKTNRVPGPYWCLLWQGKGFKTFAGECERAKKIGNPYPKDPNKMWTAINLLRQNVPDTFIKEADDIRILGNIVTHNKPQLEQIDIHRVAETCLSSYYYILSIVNEMVGSKGRETRKNEICIDIENDSSKNDRKEPKESITSDSQHMNDIEFGSAEWIADFKARLAMERAKTQEDYDIEELNRRGSK